MAFCVRITLVALVTLIGAQFGSVQNLTENFNATELESSSDSECPIGYSFHAGTNNCYRDCKTYGTEFSFQERWCIYGYNNEKYMHLGDVGTCRQLCLNATSFLCVSFEMDEDNCYLQNVTQLDVSTSVFVNLGNCDSFQRHCAEV